MARETLSALLDGECTPAEMDRLLGELERSPGLMREWSRQCAAREAREGTRMLKDQPCICAGVMAGLDDMPEEVANPKVTELASRRKVVPAWLPWKPLAGLAAAASVAAVAVLISVPGGQDGAGFNAAGNGFSAQQATVPVSLPRVRQRDLRVAAASPEELERREELNDLLLEHSGSMAGQGMGGTLHYARFAAHSAEYQPDGEQP